MATDDVDDAGTELVGASDDDDAMREGRVHSFLPFVNGATHVLAHGCTCTHGAESKAITCAGQCVCVCWGLCGGGSVDEVARATPVAARDIGNAEHKLAGPSEDAVSEGLVLFKSHSP